MFSVQQCVFEFLQKSKITPRLQTKILRFDLSLLFILSENVGCDAWLPHLTAVWSFKVKTNATVNQKVRFVTSKQALAWLKGNMWFKPASVTKKRENQKHSSGRNNNSIIVRYTDSRARPACSHETPTLRLFYVLTAAPDERGSVYRTVSVLPQETNEKTLFPTLLLIPRGLA